jgi:xanthine dehydrogenase accessory factor
LTEESKIQLEVARRIEQGKRFALVTITRTSGSTPRETGSRMIVDADGSIVGSIGGAAVERLAIEAAKIAMKTGRRATVEYDLNDTAHEQTGMICGGRLEALIEPFGTGPALHIFGAGHVAEAVARIVTEIGFDLTVYDQRPEWAAAERFPTAHRIVGDLDQLAEQFQPSPLDFIAVMTWCHDQDYSVLTRLLSKQFFYLGVIGSRKKSVEIKERLRDDGFSADRIVRITCPIGLPMVSHTPAEIAVSLAAQLLELKPKWQTLLR